MNFFVVSESFWDFQRLSENELNSVQFHLHQVLFKILGHSTREEVEYQQKQQQLLLFRRWRVKNLFERWTSRWGWYLRESQMLSLSLTSLDTVELIKKYMAFLKKNSISKNCDLAKKLKEPKLEHSKGKKCWKIMPNFWVLDSFKLSTHHSFYLNSSWTSSKCPLRFIIDKFPLDKVGIESQKMMKNQIDKAFSFGQFQVVHPTHYS